VPRSDLRKAPVRDLSRHLGPDPRHLCRLHAADRAPVAGRGLSGRDRPPLARPDGDAGGPRDPRPHPRGNRA